MYEPRIWRTPTPHALDERETVAPVRVLMQAGVWLVPEDERPPIARTPDGDPTYKVSIKASMSVSRPLRVRTGNRRATASRKPRSWR